MTRDEAITVLNMVEAHGSLVIQAKEMAIQALEQEPCEDTISRQAAIDYFVTNVGFHDENGYPIEDSDELRKIWTEYFDGIPSVASQPKTGRWIDDCGGVKCSCCGYSIDDCFYAKTYCTNCGAKMESEVES